MLALYHISYKNYTLPTLHKTLDKTDFLNFCLAEFCSSFSVKLFTVDGEL